MKKFFLAGSIAVVLLVGITIGINLWPSHTAAAGAVVSSEQIHGIPVSLELVWKNADMEQGLGDRGSMPGDHGMLFIFPATTLEPFWMRHMQFPLDIIYLRDGIVTEIAEDMPAPSQTLGIPKTYNPSEPADMVLELNSDGTSRYGIHVGDRLFEADSIRKAVEIPLY